MVNTHSQMAHQQQEPYDQIYQEEQPSHRSHISSRVISKRETPWETKDTLDEVRQCLT